MPGTGKMQDEPRTSCAKKMEGALPKGQPSP